MTPEPPAPADPWGEAFFQHLSAERNASAYTLRNYRQALAAFASWRQETCGAPPDWARLERDDFRAYLRFLGRSRLSRAAVQLRFSALRSRFNHRSQARRLRHKRVNAPGRTPLARRASPSACAIPSLPQRRRFSLPSISPALFRPAIRPCLPSTHR